MTTDILSALFELIGIIHDDPRIGVALAILAIAGVIAARLIRAIPRDEFPHIR